MRFMTGLLLCASLAWAQTSVEAAAEARAAGDMEKARALELEAEAALQKQVEANPEALEHRVALQDVQLFLLSLDEDSQLAELLAGWKARLYRRARGAALGALFKAWASAAERLADPEEPAPESVRSVAESGYRLIQSLRGGEPGEPDWAAVAGTLRAWQTAPPAALSTVVSLAYLLAGQRGVALYELEVADGSALEPGWSAYGYRGLRAFLLASHGLHCLAAEELLQLLASLPEEVREEDRPLRAGIYAYLALVHLRHGHWSAADVSIARHIELWPESPVVSFLTGERALGDGDHEQAAVSLESFAAGTRGERLAELAAERARKVRDGEEVSFLDDPEFLRELAWEGYLGLDEDSALRNRLQRWLETARELRERLGLD